MLPAAQILVDHPDHDRPVAHGRRHMLLRVSAHVAGGEDTRQAGFEGNGGRAGAGPTPAKSALGRPSPVRM